MMRAAALAIEAAQKFGAGVGLVSDPHHLGAIGAMRNGSRNAAMRR